MFRGCLGGYLGFLLGVVSCCPLRRYDGGEIRVLRRFNGEEVKTLRGLADAAAAALEKGEEEFLRFNFNKTEAGCRVLVYSASGVLSAFYRVPLVF